MLFLSIHLQVELKIWYSSDGNNPWIQSPIKVARDKLCPRINNEYRKYVMEDFKDISDLPYSNNEAEDLCAKFEMVVKHKKNGVHENNINFLSIIPEKILH